MTVREIHLVSHTHTDFGFTDYPDTLFRHHNRIIDRAIEVCEAEAGRDEKAQFRWTCEVAAITENWLRSASSNQIDRFISLHREGKMGVGGMFVHWTPLLTPANGARSMRSVARLRRDYGLEVDMAWQCDVNGLSWPWTDILIDMGMKGMVLAPNPHRGMPFETQQRFFNWQAPSGRTLPTLHGWHYSVGAWGFFLGDDDMDKTQTAIDRMLTNLERRGGYDHETILCQVTNPAAIDNGFPTNVSAFVERWNAEGRTPTLRLSTLDQAFNALLDDEATQSAPVWKGDWTDYWADGVGSTAFETALVRETERHVPALELIGALRENGESDLLDRAVEALQFYDEHTWGAFCSVIVPDSPFTRSHLSWKTGKAYEGFALTQEILAQEARGLARDRTGRAVENDIPIRRGTVGTTPIEEHSYWVLNPTSRPMNVRWPVTWDYGGAAPQTILHAYLSDVYHQDMKVDRAGFAHSPTHIISVDLPPFGEAIVKPVALAPNGTLGADWIDNGHLRLTVNSEDGSVASLVRLSDSHDWAAGAHKLGQVLYEALAEPDRGRGSIFGETGEWQYDWSRLETIAWPTISPKMIRSSGDAVQIGEARQTQFGPEIDVHLGWEHGDRATITYRLPVDAETVEVTLRIDKVAVEAPESMHMIFGIEGTEPRFEIDVGEQSITVGEEQIRESCRSWIIAQKYAAVTTDSGSLVVAPLDAPLVQPGGIHTDRATAPDLSRPELAFWLFNNHWDVNFAAAQEARRLTYRFTLTLNEQSSYEQRRLFAEQAQTRPVIVRAYDATPAAPTKLVEINDDTLDIRLRRSMNRADRVMTITNSHDAERMVVVTVPNAKSCQMISVVEEPLGTEFSVFEEMKLLIPARSAQCYLLKDTT